MSDSPPPAAVPPADRPDTMAGETGLRGTARHFVVGVFERIRGALSMSENNLFLLLAVVIGLFSGLTVVCFRITIDETKVLLLGSGPAPGPLRVLLVPTLAGLVLGVMIVKIFPRVRGSGITHTKSAVYIYEGYIPFETVISKFVCCALSIGSGQSLGQEDPSLQMGAGIASALGRRLHLSREKIRLIAPVGAAAGLAAAFNAPIAAVVFVIEEVIGTWSGGILGAVVLSAVSSVVVARLFLGAEPLFQVPPYRMAHPAELATYSVLGIAGGLSSIVFVKLFLLFRRLFRKLPRWTVYTQPAMAGLLIGVIGLRFPQVMGAGYDSMDQAMHGQFLWQVLLALALLKIVATSLSASSGAPGGMFAPTLFIGAMIGSGVGSLQHHFFPAYTGPMGSYALVGMGTLFAGFLRAPLTSVFMVLEISGNYSIIVPVMISNAIAYLIGRKFQPVPLFDLITRDEGLELPSMEERREETSLTVEDAMRKPPPVVLQATDRLERALEHIPAAYDQDLLVSYATGRWALARRSALQDAAKAGKEAQTLAEVLPAVRLPRLHPDQSLDLGLRLMRDAPFLPVVHRADARRLLGILSLDDILAAYRRASVVGGPAPN